MNLTELINRYERKIEKAKENLKDDWCNGYDENCLELEIYLSDKFIKELKNLSPDPVKQNNN